MRPWLPGSIRTCAVGLFLTHLLPGTYQVKATGDSFLPTLREGVQLRSRSKLIVNLTLSTLFEAIQWLPAQPRSPDDSRDDWKWTLRSSTNRPLLRYLEDGPLVVLSGDDDGSAPQLAARIAVNESSGAFGRGGPHHAFAMERSSAVGGHLVLRANLSPQPANGSDYVAGYQLALGPERQIRNVASFQQMSAVEGAGGQGLYVFRLRSAEAVNLGPDASLELGNEVQSVRSTSEITSSLPFLNAAWHSDGRGRLVSPRHLPGNAGCSRACRRQHARPDVCRAVGAGSILSTACTRNCGLKTTPRRARALVAFYEDELHSPVIGGWRCSRVRGSGGWRRPCTIQSPRSFEWTGPGYTTGGFRAEVAHTVGSSTWTTLSYASGKALALEIPDSALALSAAAQGLTQRKTQAIMASLDGRLVRTGTVWHTAYRWQPANTVTPVAMFDSFGNSAYLNLLIRQRIHCGHLLPNGTEALVDVRNLLAQGYRPFLTRDGSTLYFAQDARSIQGGLSFSF